VISYIIWGGENGKHVGHHIGLVWLLVYGDNNGVGGFNGRHVGRHFWFDEYLGLQVDVVAGIWD
jgi:hypothetical protein